MVYVASLLTGSCSLCCLLAELSHSGLPRRHLLHDNIVQQPIEPLILRIVNPSRFDAHYGGVEIAWRCGVWANDGNVTVGSCSVRLKFMQV